MRIYAETGKKITGDFGFLERLKTTSCCYIKYNKRASGLRQIEINLGIFVSEIFSYGVSGLSGSAYFSACRLIHTYTNIQEATHEKQIVKDLIRQPIHFHKLRENQLDTGCDWFQLRESGFTLLKPNINNNNKQWRKNENNFQA